MVTCGSSCAHRDLAVGGAEDAEQFLGFQSDQFGLAFDAFMSSVSASIRRSKVR